MNANPCPKCNSTNLEMEGHITQSVTVEFEFRCVICLDCDHWGKSVDRNTEDDPPWTDEELDKEAIKLWNGENERYVNANSKT